MQGGSSRGVFVILLAESFRKERCAGCANSTQLPFLCRAFLRSGIRQYPAFRASEVATLGAITEALQRPSLQSGPSSSFKAIVA